MHCSCPKVNCVVTEGLFVHPVRVTTRLFNVTYLNTKTKQTDKQKTKNYMIYITFLQHPEKKKDRPSDPPNFQAKRANKPLFL